jgi:hypothetical protein
MTVRELLEQLKVLHQNNAGFLEANVVCSVGVLKGIVQLRLKHDADFNLPVVYFLDDAVGVHADEIDPDERLTVLIHGGADLETPPV